MNIIQDIIYTNKDIVFKSFKSAIRNWKIFLVGIAYSIISIIMWRIAANAWILSGIIIAIFQSAIISNYLYLIENIINYDRFTFYDFKVGFTVYIRKIYIIIFIFWFVRYGISIFLSPIFYIKIGTISLWFLIEIAAFILLNSLPETIYQKYYYGLDILSYSFNFIKENWLEWYVPNLLILSILYIVHNLTQNILLYLGRYYLNYFILYTLKLLIYSIVYQLLLSFTMIYRGHLFKILSTTTRRKRMFMRNIYK